MKLILNIITIGLVFLFMAGAFLLLINKTFIYETYKEDVMTGEGIPISRFMYYQETNNSGSIFITPLSANYLNTYRSNYLNDLEQCYGEYYWDEDNTITITKYQVIDNSYYRSVNIAFVEDNYCSDEYILSDMWVYEYNNVSDYVDGDISQVAMNALINTVYSAVRVSNPVIDDSYEKQINLVITCSNLDGEYTLTFSDFSDSELLIVKEDSKGRQFAVYEIADVVNYLKNLG